MLLLSLMLSLLVGLLSGPAFAWLMSLAGFPMDGQAAVKVGLLFGLLTLPVLPLYLRSLQRRFDAAKKKVPPEVLCGATANLLLGRKKQPTAVFLCKDGLYLVNLDKKTLPVTFCATAAILQAELCAPSQLEIRLTGDRTLSLLSSQAKTLASLLAPAEHSGDGRAE